MLNFIWLNPCVPFCLNRGKNIYLSSNTTTSLSPRQWCNETSPELFSRLARRPKHPNLEVIRPDDLKAPPSHLDRNKKCFGRAKRRKNRKNNHPNLLLLQHVYLLITLPRCISHLGITALFKRTVGLKAGLALYGQDGRLRWYRSKNFGSRGSLRRAVPRLLHETSDIAWLIIEGGGPLADIWHRAAEQRGIKVKLVNAERWRKTLLLPRQQRRGHQAKHYAGQFARRVD